MPDSRPSLLPAGRSQTARDLIDEMVEECIEATERLESRMTPV